MEIERINSNFNKNQYKPPLTSPVSSRPQKQPRSRHASCENELGKFEGEENRFQFQDLENEKRLVEEAEAEKRRQRLELMEAEFKKQQEKLKFEKRLSEICECLNTLKDKFNSIPSENVSDEYNALNSIDLYNHELLKITDEIRNLSNQPMKCGSNSNHKSLSDYYSCNTLDQVAITQFNLIKTFIANLNTQVEAKKHELMRKQIAKSQLNECQDNALKLIDLAQKYLSNSGVNSNSIDDSISFYCENTSEVKDRVQSVESIENSIRSYLKQIIELNKTLNIPSNAIQFDHAKINADILQPLAVYSASLKTYLMELNAFDNEFLAFKDFLVQKLKIDELVRQSNKEISDSSIEFYDTIVNSDTEFKFGLMEEYETFFGLRECLLKKLAESDELFLRGASLFDGSRQRVGIVVGTSREFYKQHDLVNQISKYLDEKCAMLSYVVKEQNKLEIILFNVNKIQLELDQIDTECSAELLSNNSCAQTFKAKLDKMTELRKRLHGFVEEKEESLWNWGELKEFTGDFKEHENTLLYSKLEAFGRKFNNNLKVNVEELIKKSIEKISSLEVF